MPIRCHATEGDAELPAKGRKKVKVQGICRGLSSNQITRITQAKAVVVYDQRHWRVDVKVNSLLTHDMRVIICTK